MPTLRLRSLASRAFALLLVLCTAWASVSARVHSDEDDAECQVRIEQHDHSAHRIGAERVPSHSAPEHCFICHTQSLRYVAATSVVSTPAARATPIHPRLSAAAGVDLAARRPARAPPQA